MKRLALIALFLIASIGFARSDKGPPPQLPPCMAIDEMRMTHVVHVPEWPNFFSARRWFKMKRENKTIIEKLPQPKAEKVSAAKKKALAKKVKGCKPGRTRNSKGQCGSWK